jgi:hypothetical protein
VRQNEPVCRLSASSRTDATPPACSTAALLANHLEDQGVEFMQFAFRWMNCLLMRELSMPCVVRMWDTYLVRLSTSKSRLRARSL